MSKQASGILLAGTHPWGTAAFDSLIDRTLLPVANKPLIWYGLAWLHAEGIQQVAVCGNRETRMLKSHLANQVPAGLTVAYHVDAMPRGAAGSARDAALATDAETFLVADGTAIPRVALEEVLRYHHASGACLTVVTNTERRSLAEPPMQIPAGIYVFSRRAFDWVPAYGFCDIKEKLIPQLYAAGERVVSYEAPEPTPRVLDASTYMAVNEWMIERLVNGQEAVDGYRKLGDALVHRDAFVAGDATLVGPVLVSAGARVLSGAVVVGPTSIGRDAIVHKAACVSRSAVWRRSVIGEDATVDRCIVADDAVVQSGQQLIAGVIAGTRRRRASAEHADRRRASRAPALEVSTRLARFVFGASWSRSAAAE